MLVDSRHGKESKAVAAAKAEKDVNMLRQFLDKLIAQKRKLGEHHETCTVPLSVLRGPEEHFAKYQDDNYGSFGGDASGVAWSVVCHRLREALVIAMPDTLQAAIKKGRPSR